ncbi:MAG TPA: hypothetical protein VFM93_13020 [Candidatus Limnocylindria bacterium]|nr:hypothetical protein [Candidatus Limnocylindria bacterium]
MTWYLWSLVSQQLFLVPFLFLAIGAAILARSRPRGAAYPVLMASGLYIVATLLVSKDPRYTLPLLPAVAVIATSWLDGRWRRPAIAGTAVLLAYGAVTFLAVSFGTAVLPRAIDLTLPRSPLVSEIPAFDRDGNIVALRGVRVWAQQGYPLGAPSAEDWDVERLVTDAAARGGRTIWIGGPDEIWTNRYAIAYFARLHGMRALGDVAAADVAAVRARAGEDALAPPGLREIRSYDLPDGGTLRLYGRP